MTREGVPVPLLARSHEIVSEQRDAFRTQGAVRAAFGLPSTLPMRDKHYP